MKAESARKEPKAKSIEKRFLVGALSMLILFLLLLNLVMYNVDTRRQQVAQRQDAAQVLAQSSAALENWIDDQIRIVKAIAQDQRVVAACADPADAAAVADATAYLTGIHNQFPYYENIPLSAFLPKGRTIPVTVGDKSLEVASGQFFTDTTGGKTIGKGGFAMSYTQAIFDGKDYFISQVYKSLLRGNPIFVIAAPVKDERGTLVGMALIAPQMSYFTKKFVDPLKVGQTGYVIFIDDRGLVIAHPDGDYILNEEKAQLVSPITSRVIKGESSFMEMFGGQRKYYHGLKVELPQDNILNAWYLLFSQDEAEILASSRQEIIYLTTSALVFLLLYGLFFAFMTRRIVLPLRGMVAMLRNIAEGEGDLTKRLEVRSRDESGELARYFNLTLDKIRNLVLSVRQQVESLSRIGVDLATNMSETAAAVHQISANIESVRNQTINQSAGVTETNATMAQISQNIQKLDVLVGNQMDNISQSSSAIEEMLANINSVNTTLAKNAQNVQELSKATEEGRSDLQSVSNSIREIAKESESLLEISAVIENIAGQTNLLSMNASIEAAHAGEAGKGFSVVADEIRKLAESAGEQVKIVSAVVKRVKDSLGTITKSTDVVLVKFEDIDKKLRSVADRQQGIKNAMDEQGKGSAQILESVDQLKDISAQVKSGSDQMLGGSQEVIRESENLERITVEVSGSMNEMAAGVREIGRAINKVNEISRDNKVSIEALIREVGKFKLD